MNEIWLGPLLNENRALLIERCAKFVANNQSDAFIYLAASYPLLEQVTQKLLDGDRNHGVWGELPVYLFRGLVRRVLYSAVDQNGRGLPPRIPIDRDELPLKRSLVSQLLQQLLATNQGRNSEPYDDRRVCAGNTNCIPICPIQAKWDPTITLGKALDTGNVKVSYQSVAYNVAVDGTNATRVDYYEWSRDANNELTKVSKSVTGKIYVLACHAIENAKLLLMSNKWQGIANKSDQVGRNLMDHPLYLSWALAPQPIYGYRGPLATSGIESLRDGEFRKYRSSFRMEIGNEGWNFSKGDPYTTALDFIQGTNNGGANTGGTNGAPQRLGGVQLAQALNNVYTRQFRIGCMFDQSPMAENCVTLDVDRATGKANNVDGLGLPRPKVVYGLDPYTMEGFRMAAYVCSQVYQKMGAKEFTTTGMGSAGDFTYRGVNYHYYGAGHVVGTHRMGTDPCKSVVDASQRSHDVPNMWVVGSGSFPTVCTANPTLTLMALAFKSADSIIAALNS